jgi:hypothetical protein
MRINKKICSIGCATLALSIIGGVTLASIAISHDDKKNVSDKSPSYHHNYDHEEISAFIDRNYFAKKCLTTKDTLVIDEQKFRENIGDIFKFALKKMNKFTNNADNYTIELNYQLVSDKAVDIDVV